MAWGTSVACTEAAARRARRWIVLPRCPCGRWSPWPHRRRGLLSFAETRACAGSRRRRPQTALIKQLAAGNRDAVDALQNIAGVDLSHQRRVGKDLFDSRGRPVKLEAQRFPGGASTVIVSPSSVAALLGTAATFALFEEQYFFAYMIPQTTRKAPTTHRLTTSATSSSSRVGRGVVGAGVGAGDGADKCLE